MRTSSQASDSEATSAAAAAVKLTRALELQRQGRLTEAQRLCEEVLKIKPRNFFALHWSGMIAAQTGDLPRAIELIGRAVESHPQHVAAHEAHDHLGRAWLGLRQWDAALASFDRAIRSKGDYAQAHFDRGNVLCQLRRWREALASYDAAVAIQSGHAASYAGRANVLRELNDLEAALESCDRALALDARCAEAYATRGNVLHQLFRPEEALAMHDQAVAHRPDFAAAYANRGNVLNTLQRYREAVESYDRAIALGFEPARLQSLRLHSRIRICDWSDLDADVARLIDGIERGQAAANPFVVLSVSGSAELQLKAARLWLRCEVPARGAQAPSLAVHDRIRVGYFSADFHDHATTYLARELFESHDRDRFEVSAFSFGPESSHPMRQGLKRSFEHFLDCRTRTDEDIVRLARGMEIDIAVDLKGFTEGARPGIFALRAAPLQVSFLGYPGTSGADYMDYLVADHTLIPEEFHRHYTEKIIYLPQSYQVNDSKRFISPRPFTRQQLGLPSAGFVFCSFNASYKVQPALFDRWMRILNRVPGSVLWLLGDPPDVVTNLRREASARGVVPNRLVFAPRVPLCEHLARHRMADLFLDTLPCNAHTTASDALWAGLPLLTVTDEAFASRVAASLLRSVSLPELVSSTVADYEGLAVELATHPAKLERLRAKLAANRLSQPLFDGVLFARRLEHAYRVIHDRSRRGLPAEHIRIPEEH